MKNKVKWTKDQQKVIELRNRNILVSAAAGSGKTAVLVERIIQMITDKDNPIDVDRLLVVTFTKAAAREMKERISKEIEKRLIGRGTTGEDLITRLNNYDEYVTNYIYYDEVIENIDLELATETLYKKIMKFYKSCK